MHRAMLLAHSTPVQYTAHMRSTQYTFAVHNTPVQYKALYLAPLSAWWGFTVMGDLYRIPDRLRPGMKGVGEGGVWGSFELVDETNKRATIEREEDVVIVVVMNSVHVQETNDDSKF